MSKALPKLLIYASGEQDPLKGGTGAKNLVRASRDGRLHAEIVGMVSNYADGGVFTKARELGVPFIHSPKGRTAADYQKHVADTGAQFVALSGWLGYVEGLDPRTTFNIHPAWHLERFGGKHFHGRHVHEAVHRAFRDGLITFTGVSIHFVTKRYDDPTAVVFKRHAGLYDGDTPTTIAERVNHLEHYWQPVITDRILRGEIAWDGERTDSIVGADIEKWP